MYFWKFIVYFYYYIFDGKKTHKSSFWVELYLRHDAHFSECAWVRIQPHTNMHCFPPKTRYFAWLSFFYNAFFQHQVCTLCCFCPVLIIKWQLQTINIIFIPKLWMEQFFVYTLYIVTKYCSELQFEKKDLVMNSWQK